MTMPSPLASAVLVAYCGWDPTTPVINETVQLDGNGTRLLTLPSLHVTSVSSVVVTDQDSGGTYAAVLTPSGTAPADVGWRVDGCLLWRSWRYGGVWPEGEQNVAVTYSGGYLPEWVPADLNAALTSISSRLSAAPVASRRMGTAGVTYAQQVASGGLLTVEQMVLDRYRLPRVA